ncbi:MAG: glycosyltransferase [Candidatus Berkelbacteria bacterium]|nr:glycosyltransferase [Candidatus Berkelbacteria bacterium]
MKKLKVLQIIDSLQVGGAEDIVTNLSTGLKKNDCEVFVVLLSKKHTTKYTKKLDQAKIKIFFTSSKKYSLASLAEVKSLVTKLNPDIIHSHLSGYLYSFLIGGRRQSKNVHTIHNIYVADAGWKARLFQRLFLRYASATVAVSRAVAESIANPYGKKRLSIIPNGIEIPAMAKSSKPNLGKISQKIDGKIVLVNVANLKEAKNHRLLIDAFAILLKKQKNIVLLIAGGGPLKKQLKSQINQLGLKENVFLLGRRNDIRQILGISDIFVLSSKFEGTPLSVLEAMAESLPIISTRTGGTTDLVLSGKNGKIVDADKYCMAEAIFDIAKDKRFLKRLGVKSREIVEKKGSVEVMTKNYLKLYKKILKK